MVMGMDGLVVSFWILFALAAWEDYQYEPGLSVRHGIPVGLFVLFAVVAMLVNLWGFIIGMVMGSVLFIMKFVKWADVFVVAGMVSGIVALAGLSMVVLGGFATVLLAVVLVLEVRRVKGPIPVTPYAFLISLVFGVVGVVL